MICFEVLEHSTDPSRMLRDLVTFLSETGIILLSTLLQPQDIDRHGLTWWYAAPRNAHISLYSRPSLGKLVDGLGLPGRFARPSSIMCFIGPVPDPH